jgi:hypothetical protein
MTGFSPVQLAALQAGVDRSVIALWLGHESVETTQIYLEATLANERASPCENTSSARGNRSGHQGNARTASARLQSSHIGHDIPRQSRSTNAKLKVRSFGCSVLLVLVAPELQSLLMCLFVPTRK